MKTDPVFPAHVNEAGKVDMPTLRRQQMDGYIKSFKGQDIEILIRKPNRRRSGAQNNTWWGLIVPDIAEGLGYDRHEHDLLHYGLVAKCFGTHRDDKLGLDVPNKRSSKLTVEEFTELIEWAVRWAAMEHGIVCRLPEAA